MTHEVVMPQLGLTMTEGAVSAWLKQPGEAVEKGEPFFTVQTDKVEMEVEATVSGYVAALSAAPGEVLPVGRTIAILVDRKEEINAACAGLAVRTGAGSSSPAPKPGAQPAPSPSAAREQALSSAAKYAASPLAKRLARELGVDLEGIVTVKGSRISAEDVQRAHAANVADAPRAEPRAVLANRVTASFREAPHFYLGVEVDAARCVELRARLLATTDASGVRISYSDFFLKAMGQALREQATVNAYWLNGKVNRHASVDVGFAAQAEQQLLVPIIRNIDRLPLAEIARERARLAEEARAGKLTLADLAGGSATLSNLGPYGVDWFDAILNPPQSVIVATGRIAKRPVVVDGSIQARDTVFITASIDHRVLDGVAGAQFLARIRELLEAPESLLAP